MMSHESLIREWRRGSFRLKQILKQSCGFQVNEASDVIDHMLLAKRIKLRYSASMFCFLIQASKPRCRTSHH